jgi:TIR domain-containing protein
LKDDYEIVLIDSRTGLTDSGGICTIQLPDIVVAMFTANYQSLYGVRDVMRLVQQSRQRLSFDRMSLNVIPLASRFGTRSEFRESKKWLDEFAIALAEFFAEWLPSNASPRQALERMKIPQVDYFSFGERLAVVEDSSSDSEGMTPPYNMLADLIESDLKNVETILPPERWRSGSQRESRKRAEPAADGYQYDIYFSHPGDVHTTSWIREQFLPLVLPRLETLSPQKVTTFFDLQEVRAGSYWENTIADALKHSRVCLAFFTPRYFSNPWSVLEFETFMKRSLWLGLSHRPLLFPVLLGGDHQHLPPEARNTTIADFRDYFITAPAFRELPKFVEFEDAIRELAAESMRSIEGHLRSVGIGPL